MQKFLIDWSSSTVREGVATPESQRKLANIPTAIAKSTVCKKFKVYSIKLIDIDVLFKMSINPFSWLKCNTFKKERLRTFNISYLTVENLQHLK